MNKTIRALLTIVISFIVLAVGAFGAYKAVNSSDETLLPEVAEALQTAPAAADIVVSLQAFEPIQLDIKERPDVCKSEKLCSKEEFAANEAALKKYVEENKDKLARFREIMATPEPTTQAIPSDSKPDFFPFLKLVILQHQDWNVQLHSAANQEAVAKEVFNDAVRAHRYLTAALKAPGHIVSTQIVLMAIRDNRAIIKSAAEQIPAMAKELSARSAELTSDLDFVAITKEVRDAELQVLNQNLKRPIKARDLAEMNAWEDGKQKEVEVPFEPVADFLMTNGLLHNETLNTYATYLDDVTKKIADGKSIEEATPQHRDSNPVRNRYGQALVESMTQNVAHHFKKMHDSIEELRAPITL